MTALQHVPGRPRIAFRRLGEGPPLVFLHGIGGNHGQWADQQAALSRSFTTIAWDARGYGASDDYDGALEFSDFSGDLCRLLDHLKVQRAHLVGLSMGARILLDFAPDNLERIGTLTLCDFFFGFDEALTPEKREEFIALRQKPLREGKSLSDIAGPLLASLFGANPSPEAWERMTASMEALHIESYLKTIAATLRYNRGASLERISVPVQMIFGSEDRLTPPSIGEQAKLRLPDAALAVIQGAGHLSNVEAPQAFNEILGTFLSTHRDRAEWQEGT